MSTIDANLTAGPSSSSIHVSHQDSEENIAEAVDRKAFLRQMKIFGVDVEALAQRKDTTEQERAIFNTALYKCWNLLGMNIADCAVFIEQGCFDAKRVVELFDSENRAALTKALAEKYHIPVKRNKILDVFAAR